MSIPIDHENELFDLALQFIQETRCHVFLTGKAGTGKTTFLKLLKTQSKKSMIVVAPTGIAAINAGGVTMHSFFQLPFKPYIHQSSPYTPGYRQTCDRHELLSKLRFRKEKQELIRELELIVVDEVSMMRADHLEAIHQVLKFVRKNQEPFGGVQMLFIGDLNQLPPVVVEDERKIIEEQYASPYFFDAPIMKQTSCLYIELKKIYRQNEAHFIHILNRVRNNNMEVDDFMELNKRFIPDFHSEEGKYITLTSHNYKADEINRMEMDQLDAPAFSYEGKIEQDFNVKQLPVEMTITLKVGAQVMFVKNDSSEEKKFYNGKLATVTSLTENEIVVVFSDSRENFTLTKEEWKNISYELNEASGRIEEKVIGKYIQYPVRSAWAITIHKSQGLTFDHAIVDAGSSFAPGQVYVALSRCTHLEGLVLRSKITPGSIHRDERIHDFARNELSLADLKREFSAKRIQYEHQRILDLFRFDILVSELDDLHRISFREHTHIPVTVTEKLQLLMDVAKEVEQVGRKFSPTLHSLLKQAEETQSPDLLKERCSQATPWFSKKLYESFIRELAIIQHMLKAIKSARNFSAQLKETEDRIWKRIEKLHSTAYLGQPLSPPKETMPVPEITQDSIPNLKLNTVYETLQLIQEGKTIQDIATIRNLKPGTIEKHMLQLLEKGELPMGFFLNTYELEEILSILPKTDIQLKPIYEAFDRKYSYLQLRAASFYVKQNKEPVSLR